VIEFLMVAGAPTPVAPFSHAVACVGWLFVTGQMPIDPDDDGAPLAEGRIDRSRSSPRSRARNASSKPARRRRGRERCRRLTGLAGGALVEIDLMARR